MAPRAHDSSRAPPAQLDGAASRAHHTAGVVDELFDEALGALVAAAGALAGAIVLWRSDDGHQPRWHSALVVLAFATTIVWLDIEAGELVGVTHALGALSGLSSSVMGLTLLAWGNSVGDLVADVAVARRGGARMAVATCFGSPMLNDVLGLGLALSVGTAREADNVLDVHLTASLFVAYGFLFASLLSSLVVFHAYDYDVPREYAFVLLGLYVALLATQGVLLVLE